MQLLQPLNAQEIDNLAQRLRQHNGVDVSTLDGILTAIACYPRSPSPEQWLPLILPKGRKEALADEKILRDSVRHLNGIESILSRNPDAFTPLFFERDLADGTEIIVDNWCRGFVSSMSINPALWRAQDAKFHIALEPILIFASQAASEQRQRLSYSELVELKQSLPYKLREIYRFLFTLRPESKPHNAPHHFSSATTAKWGRNERCPCGSGKKYKLCCGLH